jgi:tRNA G10  N-methylase Trm11
MITMQSKLKALNNYEDYSSGRVIYSASGATNFPVRLSNQIFEICVDYLKLNGNNGPYRLYDPFCGFAYTLTTLGFMYSTIIRDLYASDVEQKSIEFAEKNLSLLSGEGISKRITEIESLIDKFGKDSHKEALQSAYNLQAQMTANNIQVASFKYDALGQFSLPEYVNSVDLVIVDLPYGQLTHWSEDTAQNSRCQVFLDNIKDRLSEVSIVAITSDKKQVIEHQGYERIKKFNTGKRRTILLRQS